MPTLYVENVPEELYSALRRRARAEHRSISAQVIAILERAVPTEAELKRRRESLRRLEALRFTASSDAIGPFPTSEEMIREDRDR